MECLEYRDRTCPTYSYIQSDKRQLAKLALYLQLKTKGEATSCLIDYIRGGEKQLVWFPAV